METETTVEQRAAIDALTTLGRGLSATARHTNGEWVLHVTRRNFGFAWHIYEHGPDLDDVLAQARYRVESKDWT